MAKPKGRSVVKYLPSEFVCFDLGEAKSPRFVLYDPKEDKVIAKAHNPIDFDDIIFQKEEDGITALKEVKKKPKRQPKTD